MTRDEVIRLAKEAGIPDDNIPSLAWGRLETGAQLLERFAALVASAAADRARQEYEREHCRHVVPLPDALQVMIDDAVAAEREACAKVCDERHAAFADYYTQGLAGMCAATIRARGTK